MNSLGNYSSKISTSIWSASEISGGIDNNLKSVFDNEMADTAVKIAAKIGIVYISDLGYATEPTNWTNKTWKNSGIGCFGNFYGWTITSSGGGLAWYRGGSDYVNGFVDLDPYPVRPTFFPQNFYKIFRKNCKIFTKFSEKFQKKFKNFQKKL